MNYVRRMFGKEKPLVRVLPLVGSIRASRGGKNVSLAGLEKQIAQSFECKRVQPKAVVLEINSNGGSAVQSNLIYQRIRNLSDKTKVPVISHVQDAAVSGGYWLALAGDEIYADPNSAVGSVGVVSMMFGLEEVIRKLGIEPRFLTAGKHKLRINPFESQNPEDIEWMKNFIGEVHENFKNLVKERRKSINKEHQTVFEADVFTGKKAAELGLIDGTTSDIHSLLRKKFGDNVVIKRVEARSMFPFGIGRYGADVKLNFDDAFDSLANAQSKYKMF